MDNKLSILIKGKLDISDLTQDKINKQLKNLKVNLTADTKEVEKAINDARRRINNTQSVQLINARDIETQIQRVNNSLARLKINKDKVFADTRVSSEVNKLKEMENAFKRGEISARQYSLQLDTLRTRVAQVSGEFRNANRDGYSFNQMLTLAAKKIAIWGISTNLVYGSLNQLKSGISYIYELDNSLNQIRIVTNKTQVEVENLADSYNKLGKEMSVTTKELAATSADLYRQGLDDSQVEERMKSIIQYAKISDLSLQESNTIITATANATGEGVQKIIDIFALLGDTTASGADEIGEALQRVASASENSNISLEKSASWLATISSITRESASTIGRSLNSVISRYESIKKTGFNEEDATKLNDVTKALSDIGIKATDSEGQLLDFATVMDMVGSRFDKLSKNEKAYIATTMFGTYQRNRGITLLSNYNDSLKNYENALNAAGTAESKFNTYQESTAAYMDRLKASWEDFWQSSLDSGMIKGAISALITLIDTFGNLSTIILSAVTVLVLWKGTQITATVALWAKSIITLNVTMADNIRYMIIAKAEAMGWTKAQVDATIATNGLKLAMNGLKVAFLSNPIGIIAVALTSGIMLFDIFSSKMDSTSQKAKDEFNELKQSIGSLKKEIADTSSLANQYDLLSSKASLTTEEENKLVDVRRKLASQFPDLIEGYDSEGKAILGSSQAIRQAIKDNEELLKTKQDQMSTTFITDSQSNFSQLQEDQERLELLKKHKEEYLTTIEEINKGNISQFDTSGNDLLAISKNNLKGINDELSNLSEKVLQERKDLSDLADAFLQSSNSAQSLGKEAITQLIYDLSTLKDESKITEEQFSSIFDGLKKSDFSSELNQAKSELEELAKSGVSEENITNAYEKAITGLLPYLKALGINGEEAGKILKDMLDMPNATDASNKINSVATSLSDLQKALSDSSSAISEVNSVLSEFEESGSFNLDSLIKLSEKYPELLMHLGDEKAIRQDLTNIIQQEQDKSRDAYADMLFYSTEFYNKNIEGVQNLVNSLNLQREVDLSGAKDLAEAKLRVEEALLKTLASKWADYYDAQGNMTGMVDALGLSIVNPTTGKSEIITPEMRSQFSAYQSALSNVQKKFDAIALKGTSGIDFSKIGMGSGDKDKKDKKNDPSYTDPTDAIIDQINQQNLLTKAKAETIEKEIETAKSSKDYNLALEKTNTLISTQQLRMQQLNEARLKINAEKDKMNDYSRWFTNDNEQSVAYVQEYNSASVETQKNMEAEFSKLQKLRNAWLENNTEISELTSSLSDLQSSLQSLTYDLVTQQLSTFTSSLDSTNSQLELSKARMSLLSDTSSEYRQELIYQTKAYQDLIDTQRLYITYAKEQLENDNLSIEAKEELRKSIQSATISQLQYQKAVQDIAKDLATQVIEKQKALAQQELDEEEEILNAYIKRKEEKIEGLQEELDALQEIADEENEQEERQKKLLEIEKAKLNLAKAQSQQNTRIYVEGEGFTWQSNPTDVKNAQDDLKSLQEDYLDWEDDINLQHQKDALQAEIDYQQSLIDARQEAFDEQKTQFEEQWSNIDALSTQLLEEYSSNIDSAVEILSEKLIELNKQLNDLVEESTSLSSLSNFNSGGSSSSNSTGISSNNLDIKKSGSYDSTTGNYTIRDDEGNVKTGNGSLSDYEKEFDKMHTGGAVGKLPYNLKADEIPKILQLGEFVLSKDMLKSIADIPKLDILSNISIPKMPDLSGISLNSSAGTITLNIGDVHLTGVNDVNSLSKAIVSKLPNKIIQDLFKKS